MHMFNVVWRRIVLRLLNEREQREGGCCNYAGKVKSSFTMRAAGGVSPLIHPPRQTHGHAHAHTRCFLWLTSILHRRNGFYTVQSIFSITLHLNLPLTGNFVQFYFLKKTLSVWFISVLNYGDTENVLINHLLLVISMSYPCHYTNLCTHKLHEHARTHTHTHMHTYAHTHTTHTHTHTLFTYPHVVPNLTDFLQWDKKDDFWRNILGPLI